MKRCPECEFLYEDAQDRCDMDGARLNATVTLPPLPQAVVPPLKSIWSGFTIPLLILVLLSTVLVILYRAAPPSFRSSGSLKKKEVVNQDSRLPASEGSPELVIAPKISPEPDERSTETQTKATKANRVLRFTIAKEPTAAPESHSKLEPAIPTESAPKPPTSQPLENVPPPATEKPQAGSISDQPAPPPPSTPSQPATQNQQKESRVKSFWKKAGRILKKPF